MASRGPRRPSSHTHPNPWFQGPLPLVGIQGATPLGGSEGRALTPSERRRSPNAFRRAPAPPLPRSCGGRRSPDTPPAERTA